MKREQGFTLLEMLVVLAIASALSGVMLMAGNYAADWQKARETRAKLAETADLWRRWADASAGSYPGAWAATAEFTIAGADAATAMSTAGVATPTQAQQAMLDGYGRSVRVYVSAARGQLAERGLTARFRDFYVVSPGENGAFDLTFDQNGELATTGDDVVLLVSGYDSAVKWLRTVFAKADRLEQGVRSYFQARYLLDPSRDAFVDYFFSQSGNAASDPGVFTGSGTPPIVTIPSSATVGALYVLSPSDTTAGSWAGYFGLSDQDVRSPDGSYIFSLQLTGSGTRSPPSDAPPFTVRVHVAVPATQAGSSDLKYTFNIQAPI